MTIVKKMNGSCAELYLGGWMDAQSVSAFTEALELAGAEIKTLVLDMTKLEYISSAGIRQIISAYKKMNGAFKLRHVSAEIMDVLHMTGLDQKLDIEE